MLAVRLQPLLAALVLGACAAGPSGPSKQNAGPATCRDLPLQSAIEDAYDGELVITFVDDRGEPLAGRSLFAKHVVWGSDGRYSYSRVADSPRELDDVGAARIPARVDWDGEMVISLGSEGGGGHANPSGEHRVEWDGRAGKMERFVPRLARIEGRVVTPAPNHGVEISVSNASGSWYLLWLLAPRQTYEGFEPESMPLDLDETGRFVFDDITPGTFDVSVRRGSASATKQVTIEPGATLSTLTFDLNEVSGWIIGELQDGDGLPIEGAEVRAVEVRPGRDMRPEGSILEVESDSLGRFRLGATLDALYHVRVTSPLTSALGARSARSPRATLVETYARGRPRAEIDMGVIRVATSETEAP